MAKKIGRPTADKEWSTEGRVHFYTSFRRDPEIHVWAFLNQGRAKEVIGQALRRAMEESSDPILDPNYRLLVATTAAQLSVQGIESTPANVIASIAGHTAVAATPPPSNQPAPRVAVAAPAPPMTVAPPIPASTPMPTAFVSATPVNAPVPTDNPGIASASIPAATPTTQNPPRKQKMEIDFGSPDPELSAEEEVEAPKVSRARDTWLARHKRGAA